jgi:hypothetical protein
MPVRERIMKCIKNQRGRGEGIRKSSRGDEYDLRALCVQKCHNEPYCTIF